MIKRLYPEVLFCMLVFLLSAKNMNAQTDKPFDFTGTWKITNYKLVDYETPSTLRAETSLWSDLLTKGEMLMVDKDGRASFKRESDVISTTFNLKDGILTMTFCSGVAKREGVPIEGGTSITQFSITFSVNSFTIFRNDPSVSESYTFTKVN